MSKLFLVYGTEQCTLCKQATKMLEQQQQTYLYKIVGKDITQTDFFEMLEAVGATETRSLPQIVMIGDDWCNREQVVNGSDIVKSPHATTGNLAFYVGAGQKGLIELAKMLK